ncbi:MAG: hypothetical protein NDJ90_06855 [Oligoflexia bacterium]|nr:hypothetical protein [Oligoflexia bacterium]
MKLRHLLLSFVSLTLSGFGSCSRSMDQLCASNFPRYEQDFEVAALKLNEARAERRLASSSSEGEGARGDPAKESREAWLAWAERHIKEAQDLMDVIQSEPELGQIRKELSALADQLVSFHGYASRGKQERMTIALAKAREHQRKARALACETPH